MWKYSWCGACGREKAPCLAGVRELHCALVRLPLLAQMAGVRPAPLMGTPGELEGEVTPEMAAAESEEGSSPSWGNFEPVSGEGGRGDARNGGSGVEGGKQP